MLLIKNNNKSTVDTFYDVQPGTQSLGKSATLHDNIGAINTENNTYTGQITNSRNDLNYQNWVIAVKSDERNSLNNSISQNTNSYNWYRGSANGYASQLVPTNSSVLPRDHLLNSDDPDHNRISAGPYVVTAESSGYLTVRDTGNNIYWVSNIWRRPNNAYMLIMQSDGNLVSYDQQGAFYASNTNWWTFDKLVIDGNGTLALKRDGGNTNFLFRLANVNANTDWSWAVPDGFQRGPWRPRDPFPHPSASWIWWSPKSHEGAPSGYANFIKAFYVNSLTPISATLYIAIDDKVVVFLSRYYDSSTNNVPVVEQPYICKLEHVWDRYYNYSNITVQPGQNVLYFAAYNNDGPAGLIYALHDDTNNNWLAFSDFTTRRFIRNVYTGYI